MKFLRDLYHEIFITKEVYEEFGGTQPDWIMVCEVKDLHKISELENRLDKGEASSIALALEIPNCTLIIDEVKGRKIATSLNLDYWNNRNIVTR
ncbi:MAG: hypothetical protein HC830_03335 [Bacteroidetes bacterium]|nr:hypothetical protein [Bacteroidota bacterium]